MANPGDPITTVEVQDLEPGPDTYVPSGHSLTILMDAEAPVFVVEVPAVRVGTPKPTPFDQMTTYFPPVIAHFWPFWEGSGSTVKDIIDPSFSGVIKQTLPATIAWSSGKNGYALTGADLGTTDDVTVPEIVLSGSFSLDYLALLGSTWSHILITNDSVNGLVHYTNGIQQSTAAYVPTMTITELFHFVGITSGALEYFRVWRRVLNLVEIQSLAADPYCMFGITQETLDEITAVVNFMTPAKEGWYFLFT